MNNRTSPGATGEPPIAPSWFRTDRRKDSMAATTAAPRTLTDRALEVLRRAGNPVRHYFARHAAGWRQAARDAPPGVHRRGVGTAVIPHRVAGADTVAATGPVPRSRPGPVGAAVRPGRHAGAGADAVAARQPRPAGAAAGGG